MRFLVEVSRGEGRRLDGAVRREGDDQVVPFWGIAGLVGVLEAFLDEAREAVAGRAAGEVPGQACEPGA